jgi:FtsP/CotA-like multicopper oxidase with cupredoxin domain
MCRMTSWPTRGYCDGHPRVKAHFDRAGLYVWHCHLVEHEDNEVMRPCRIT